MKTNTIEITNFGGRLTRKKNGDIKSGLAKFSTSFGYDPFSKPGQLTWLEAPTDISPTPAELIVAAKPRYESVTGSTYIYALGNSKTLFKITPNSISTPNLDTSSVLSTLPNGSVSYGASMDFFGTTEKIFIGMDDRVVSVNFDGSGAANVGTVANYTANVYRPLKQFIGKLFFGNKNNVGAIDATETVTSPVVSTHYEQLSPGLPQETYLTDLDLAPDGEYLLLTTSGVTNENLATVLNDKQAAAASNGAIYKWNGSDTGITATTTIPSYAVTAMQTFLDSNMFFSNDSFGASLSNGATKLLTMPNNKSPFANSTLVNGNFTCWVTPEVTDSASMVASMYYYGQLDEDDNTKGLWRVMRYSSTLTGGFIYQTPLHLLTNNKYSTVNTAITAVATLGYGKHYFSVFDVNNTTSKFTLQRFLITPTGTGTPQLGVYETQNQLFSEKIKIKQIRVYTEPTVTGNGFQLDVIDNNGSVVTNGSFTYSYSAGTDETLLQGALERINFNPAVKPLYSVGIRITNTGTTNMVINKVEIDWEEAGK